MQFLCLSSAVQLVMQFLYSGGCNSFDVVAPGDILELMAAASFFQLEDLLRYTEARCSQMIDIDNVVAMYIHAKVIKYINDDNNMISIIVTWNGLVAVFVQFIQKIHPFVVRPRTIKFHQKVMYIDDAENGSYF